MTLEPARLTTVHQERAVHELGKHPRNWQGTALVVDDLHGAAAVLEEDGVSAAWLGWNQPEGWEMMRRTPENCRNFRYLNRLQKLGHTEEARYASCTCWMGIPCGHIVAERGPHGRRAYPVLSMKRASGRARILLINDGPPEIPVFVPIEDLQAGATVSEYRAYKSLLEGLASLQADLPADRVLAHHWLYESLERAVPDLSEILAEPVTPGPIFDPTRLYPEPATVTPEEIDQLSRNCAQVLEAVRDDWIVWRDASRTSFESRVRLVGSRNSLEFSITPVLQMAAITTARSVVLPRRLRARWMPLLLELGLTERSSTKIVGQKEHRGGEALRWIPKAGRQLLRQGFVLDDLTQTLLAREAGFNRSTASRYWSSTLTDLTGWLSERPWISPASPR